MRRNKRKAKEFGRITARAAGLLLAAFLCFLITGCGVSGSSEGVPAQSSKIEAEKQFKNETEETAKTASALNSAEEREEIPDDSAEKTNIPAGESADESLSGKEESRPQTQEDLSEMTGSDPKGEESISGSRNEDLLEESTNINSTEENIELLLQNMSLEAKVAQMFVLLPEQLTGVPSVTQAGETTRASLESFPVGGLIYMGDSLESYEQTKELLTDTQQLSYEITGLPMLTFIDEEGGIVRRISGTFPEVPEIESMAALGNRGSTEEAFQTGQTIGSYLADLGFTCDCAPVADVLTNPYNTVIGERSFGSDPQLVAEMAAALGNGLESEGVTAVYKHFPGHGGTSDDSHEGYTVLEKTKEELYDCELIPFIRAIEGGAKIIMTAHISLPYVTEEDLPASLNYEILTGLLRGELGFEGVILTDALNMGAIANQYTSGEAAVLAIQAGADLLLMPLDPYAAYQQVLWAVESGELSEERINESVRRILKLKESLN